jgi:hypothetical protein
VTTKPTDEQVRAGADALVRLRTQAPSIKELDTEEQEPWLADARAVLAAALATPAARHILSVAGDGWSISHPADCTVHTPTGPQVICPVGDLAAEQIREDLTGWKLSAGQWAVEADAAGERLVLLGRVDQTHGGSEFDSFAVERDLDDAAAAFAAASTSDERTEVIRDMLARWYAAWPPTAGTDEHEPIAYHLVSMIAAAEARASGVQIQERITEAVTDLLVLLRWQPEPLSDLLDAGVRLAEATGVELPDDAPTLTTPTARAEQRRG